MPTLTAAACRAGRAILKWSVRDLAREAGVSPNTVFLIESERPFRKDTALKIIKAFDRRYVEIIADPVGTGARLRLDRGDLHDAFADIVEELASPREGLSGATREICQMILANPRVSYDQLPGHLDSVLEEYGRPGGPGTYGNAARLILAELGKETTHV